MFPCWAWLKDSGNLCIRSRPYWGCILFWNFRLGHFFKSGRNNRNIFLWKFTLYL